MQLGVQVFISDAKLFSSGSKRKLTGTLVKEPSKNKKPRISEAEPSDIICLDSSDEEINIKKEFLISKLS